MGKFFIKVLHEEPLDKLTLETIKGGAACDTFTCGKYSCGCNLSYIKPVCPDKVTLCPDKYFA